MHSKKRECGGSRDLITSFPEELRCHILSFLPTKEAASTSVLSKRWKSMLAFVPNLDFDDSIYLHNKKRKNNSECFMDFVDSVLALQANARLNKFHLKCKDFVDPYRVLDWIPKVLERGVLDLDIYISSSWKDYDWIPCYYPLPSEIFASKTLVKLKIRVKYGVSIDVEDISLPKLKSLHLDRVWIENFMFAKLLSSCHELEELHLENLFSDTWEPFSVSTTTIKRLRFCRTDYKDFHWNFHNVSFDLPNLVYLEYSDFVAFEYPKVRFDSLVEARLDLRLADHQISMIRLEDFDQDAEELEGELVISDVTNLLIAIRNVKILYLYDDTLEVLNYCCETMPEFDSLTHLTIKTDHEVYWRFLSPLLKNCPNLDTFILEEDVPTDLLSLRTVKYYKTLECGENCDDNDMEEHIKQVELVLETMPHLQKIVLYGERRTKEDVIKVSNQLQMLPKVASSSCEIQVISDKNLMDQLIIYCTFFHVY